MLRRMTGILLVAVCLLSLAGCNGAAENNTKKGGEEKETVTIAYLPITHALPLFETAERLNGDAGLNVELVKFSSWPELLDALNTGRVDGASVLIELAMKSKAQGIGLKAVALGHKDGNVIVAGNNIGSGADLKGKAFAIPHRQSSHNILFHDMLQKEGLLEEDIEIIELSPAEMPSALASGQIAGYCVAEPFGAKAVSLGVGNALYESSALWEDSLCCSLVLTEDFIDSRKETAKLFVQSYKEAGQALTDDEAERVAEKYLDQEEDVLNLSLEWISFDDLEISEEMYTALTEKVKEYGLMDNPPSYGEFVDNSLIR